MGGSAPHSVSTLWLGTMPQIRASCKAKLMSQALFGSYDHLDKMLSWAKAVGQWADWQLCETEIREEKRKGKARSQILRQLQTPCPLQSDGNSI